MASTPSNEGEMGIEGSLSRATPIAPATIPIPSQSRSRITDHGKGVGIGTNAKGKDAVVPPRSSSCPSPELSASWLSRVTWWWMTSILLRGISRPLEDEDCYELKSSLQANKLADEFDREWATEKLLAAERAKQWKEQGEVVPPKEETAPPKEENKGQEKDDTTKKNPTERSDIPPPRHASEPSLGDALWRLHSSKFWLAGLCKAITDGLGLLQPMLLNMLLTFLIDWEYNPQFGAERPEEWKGYVLAAAIGICPLVGGMLENAHQHIMTTIGFKVRTVLIEKMYMKSMRLSPGARAKFSTGKIMNTMSSDTFLIDQFAQYAHLCWSAICQIIVAIALLIDAIGWAAAVGLCVIFVALPVAGVIMHRWMQLYEQLAPIKDGRVKMINEILQGIRVIKVYVWESSFLRNLLVVRDRELGIIRSQQMLFVWTTTLWTCTPLLISLVSFITLGLTSDNFTPARVYTAISLFNVLRMPLMMGPGAMAQGASAAVALRRIEIFLLADELQWAPTMLKAGEFELNGRKCAVEVKDGTFEWEVTQGQAPDESKVRQVTKEQENQVATSSQAKEQGQLTTEADSSFAVQKSALDSPSSKVTSAFQLTGINLSVDSGSLVCVVGGVGSGKSSLVSALLGEMRRLSGSVTFAGEVAYCPQQAWIQNATLEENVLFGKPMDAHKYAEALHFSALEHDVAMLPAGDKTEIGEKGITLSGGQKARCAIARAIFSGADILLLDDPLSAVDAHVGNFLFHTCIRDHLRDRTRILVTHQLQYVQHADYIFCMDDSRIAESGTYASLMAANGAFSKLINEYGGKKDEEVEGHTEEASSSAVKGVKKPLKAHGSKAGDEEVAPPEVAKLMQVEERERGGVAVDVYLFYLKACGGWMAGLVGLCLMCCASGAESYGSWWVSDWTEDKHGKSQNFYVGIYTAIALSQVVFTVITMAILTRMSVRASRELHAQSFERVLRAPASFFDTTPLGRILNRFSRDQDLIDAQLMHMVQNVLNMAVSLTGMVIIIAIVIPWILIPFAVTIVLYGVVERAFRNSNRELKRIESINRSPLYAHFAETLTGLSTIRAYASQSIFIHTHMHRLDQANRSTYLQLMTQRWLSVRVEAVSAVIAFFSAVLVVIQRDTVGAGQAGLAVSYAISLPLLLNWLVRCTSEAESAMSAVERAKYYAEQLPQEAPSVLPRDDALIHRRPSPWPASGTITFDNVRLRYRPELPFVLKGVSFTIKAGERIGVVGRTGAGKSSLMVALYRMVELDPEAGGSILIDGVNISSLGLGLLRNTMAIIPQDSLLFSGTVRSNLDPFNEHTDEEVWSVLERAHLAVYVRTCSQGLTEPIAEGGENLSVGQRSQMCLARAMLRSAKILIMDEATAAIDMQTDAAIQMSLRRDFADRTLLTIAHRLHTIIDYDRVCVMSDGVVAEFDSPARLLRNPNSAFRKMVDDTGPANAQLLTTLALRAEQGWHMNEKDLEAGAEVSPDHDLTSPSFLAPPTGMDEYDDTDGRFEVSRVHWHEDSAIECAHPTDVVDKAAAALAEAHSSSR